MERLLSNLSSKVRRETLHGRSYLVAPSTLIVPGVLPGSQGPLFYSERETSRDPDAWNGMPMVMGHPTRNGRPVSARRPDILKESQVGYVFGAGYDGKLQAENWFDEELTKNYDKKHGTDLYGKVQRGEKIEQSTGVFTRNRPKEGTYNGKKYLARATRLRPDHLAILLDAKGACSVADGCGVNNGLVVNPAWVADEALWEKAKAAALKAYSEDDPEFYAVVTTIYKNMGGDVKKQTNNSNPTGGQIVTKQKMVSTLTANCDCWKGQEKVLNSMDEEQLKKLLREVRKNKSLEKLATNAKKGIKVGSKTLVLNEASGEFEVTDNAPPTNPNGPCPDCGAKMKDGTCPKCGYEMPTGNEGDDDEPTPCKSTVTNKGKNKGRPSSFTEALEEFGTPEEKAVWNAAKRAEKRDRLNLVKRLVANIEDDDERQERGNKLMKKSIDDLEEMVALLPKPKQTNNRHDPDDDDEDEDRPRRKEREEVYDFSGADVGRGRSIIANKNRKDRPTLKQPRSSWDWIHNVRKGEAKKGETSNN